MGQPSLTVPPKFFKTPWQFLRQHLSSRVVAVVTCSSVYSPGVSTLVFAVIQIMELVLLNDKREMFTVRYSKQSSLSLKSNYTVSLVQFLSDDLVYGYFLSAIQGLTELISLQKHQTNKQHSITMLSLLQHKRSITI